MKLITILLSTILLLSAHAEGQYPRRSQEISFGDQSPIISGAASGITFTYINLTININCASEDSTSCEEIIHKAIEFIPGMSNRSPANINFANAYSMPQSSYYDDATLNNAIWNQGPLYIPTGVSDTPGAHASRDLYSWSNPVSDVTSSFDAALFNRMGSTETSFSSGALSSSGLKFGPDGKLQLVISDSTIDVPGFLSNPWSRPTPSFTSFAETASVTGADVMPILFSSSATALPSSGLHIGDGGKSQLFASDSMTDALGSYEPQNPYLWSKVFPNFTSPANTAPIIGIDAKSTSFSSDAFSSFSLGSDGKLQVVFFGSGSDTSSFYVPPAPNSWTPQIQHLFIGTGENNGTNLYRTIELVSPVTEQK